VIRVAAGIAVLGLVLAVALALWADSRGAPWWADLLVACAPLLLLTVPAVPVRVSVPRATVRRV
jgi:hypothetical protein